MSSQNLSNVFLKYLNNFSIIPWQCAMQWYNIYGDNIDKIDKQIIMRVESVVRDVPCWSRIGIV